MRSQTYRTKLWNLTCCFILALMLEHDLMEGIRWINIPSQINKCPGQTANLTWEYVKEADEEIRQLQWRLNTTTLIAYRSDKIGLHVDPKYEGRVESIGDSGILLKNITSKDIGNYTLYPVISWKENTTIQSIWLNVIEVTIHQWCTCERLPISREWSSGQTVNIVSDGCNLEINSSFCCIKGPATECMEHNPQKLCLPIRDSIILTESTTQSRNINNLTESTTQSRNPNNLTESTTQSRNPNNLTESITQSSYPNNQTESTTQSRIVPEQTVPTDVRKGFNILVYLTVASTIMMLFLCGCGLSLIWRKIRQGYYHRKQSQSIN